ncbi:hypothetical protein [Methylobacterium aerolatum]|uniref:Uncharacterized protein n=1 Tax=Methylobacterium aerolatum TaxID=418708 RepID=A0ABU0HVN5_9HYPH|nr:hypothetical protein [Methylobacterium aerolatum]MDQ0446392.1 hypothetical protein [Methylobacterium aerolatum]GJD33445.1 hypothetical protein FMGBMHLM_0332 [Methylobacterium aerolatum]
MTFTRIDRVLTRLWLGLAACLALAGGMQLGAAVGHRGATRGGDVRCAQMAFAGAVARPGEPVIHRDPAEAGNLRRARPLWPATSDLP